MKFVNAQQTLSIT